MQTESGRTPSVVASPGSAPAEAIEHDLFPSALRAAIAARGVSLDRIRTRMSARGASVSVATLSYWQSGRSRPERPSSLRAIVVLEDVLELPRGFLSGKIAGHEEADMPHYQDVRGLSMADETDHIAAAMSHLGLTFDDGLQRLSYHDQIEVKANRTDGMHTVRMVLRALRDGVDRYPVYLGHDDPAAFPFVTAVTNCRLGRVIEFRHEAAVVAEMLLERPLAEGESVLVEHRLEAVGQSAQYDHFHRLVVNPIREMVIDIRFHPDAMPASGERVATVDGIHTVSPLDAPAASLRTLELDVPPGIYGINWAW